MDGYVLSISAGVYTRGMGGTNKVIEAHQKMFNERGLGYVYLCPARNAVTRTLRWDTAGYWDLIVDGSFRGVVDRDGLLALRKKLRDQGRRELAVFIHHLLGLDIQGLKELLGQTDSHLFFYLHDYYTICPNYDLLDPQGLPCGRGEARKAKCAACPMERASRDMRGAVGSLLESVEDRVTIVAPSDTAGELWVEAYPKWEDKVAVIYHQKLLGAYQSPERAPGGPVKVAFVGSALPSKGWEGFVKTVDALGQREDLAFYHLGSGGEPHQRIKQMQVVFHGRLNAMVEALRGEGIEVAILWSPCPETYSYTYYESLAAGAFVIAREGSGNIEAQVRQRGNGIVLRDDKALHAFLADREGLARALARHRSGGAFGPEELRENERIVDLVLARRAGRILEDRRGRPSPLRAGKRRLLSLSERATAKAKEIVNGAKGT